MAKNILVIDDKELIIGSMYSGIVWWSIIGIAALAILIWFFKDVFVFVVCPFCNKWHYVAKGTFEYSKTFSCPYCKRELTKNAALENKNKMNSR